ncbi:MAG: glycosyltransferase family 4 protein [Acidimicrobiales bacterium]|nr:glycosyltransferase family 4 protein [Acidimicrobiales bacterium]
MLPRFIGGGPERSVLTLARHAAAQGTRHEHVIAVLEPPLASRLVLQARRLGIAVVPRPDDETLRALVRDTDVVQIHYWNHPELRRLLETVELPPARIVVWARVLGTTVPQVLPAELGRFTDRLVLTSDTSRDSDAVAAALAAGTRVTTIPGVTDPARLEGCTSSHGDGRCVGYLGSVDPTKLHPRFVELAAAVPVADARFVVCGGGGGEEALRRRADELGLGARFTARGHVEDICRAFGEFDVFGYPLAADTFATSEKALQEAMWVGLAPVVLPHGGAAELVEDGVTGLVATTEADYPAAVARLLRDGPLRRRLGDQARRWVRTAFDPARWARVAVDLVDELAREPRRGRDRLPGGGRSGAASFVRSLGSLAAPFERSLRGVDDADAGVVDAADRRIADAGPLLARGEGGILHYRNAFPDDPHLRLWSALVLATEGSTDVAEAELAAAAALGLGDDRPARYLRTLTANGSP